MGSEHNKLKKDSKYSDFFDSKKLYKNRLSEGSTQHNSHMLKDLQKEKETNDDKITKSKTELKFSETAKEKGEENKSSKKQRKVTMDGLKSFSSQNLVKIDQNSDISENEEKTSPNSPSNPNTNPIKELYEEEEKDISEEDDGEGEEIKESKKKETEEELMVPNNMKKVFIDSRANKNSPTSNKTTTVESSISENSTSSSSNVITANDYELNFYRNGIDIRQSYLSKLLTTKVWTPNMKPKKHNCIIIFDWDDTLLPTSFLTKGGNFYEEMQLSPSEQKKMLELQDLVLELLNETIEKGTVYIITNAGKGWVEYSAERFYPKITPILDKIQIISARGQYENEYPGNSRQWKIEAFLMLQNTVNLQLVTNIICLGDSLFEMEAGRILASRFTEAFIKTIKFRESPKLDELIKQLKLVVKQFSSIYISVKNLTIRVERKKK
jgi:hypothetical protein